MDNLKIKIPEPDFGSDLNSIILDLEKLRSKKLYGEIPPHIFFQLKNIFQILETLGSVRIEGNNTTLSEYVEKIIESEETDSDEKEKELQNINEAIKFIEKNTDEETKIDRAYISELHKIVVEGLTSPPRGEGSNYPGEIRPINVDIQKSKHTPPEYIILSDHVEEFFSFINSEYKEQYQLLVVAIANHRFSYIHMFDNGNGRVGRLLNYALLIKLGFKVKKGRILNPSAIFYSDREKYYKLLGKADSLKDKDILEWSEYFLNGLRNEIKKIDNLLEKVYVKEKILMPAIKFALDRKTITEDEFKILEFLIKKENMQIKSEELSAIGIEGSTKKSRIMAKLRDKNMITSLPLKPRVYTIRFANNYLLRGVIKTLDEEGFISKSLNKN